MQIFSRTIFITMISFCLGLESAELEKRAYKNGDSVAIIGAGAGGFGVLSALIKQGVPAKNITVLERNAIPGGKIESLNIDGRAYELGADIIVPGKYKAIEDLLNLHGLTTRKMPEGRAFDLDTGLMVDTFGGFGAKAKLVYQYAKYKVLSYRWRSVLKPDGFARIHKDLRGKSWKDIVREYSLEELDRSVTPILGGSGHLRSQNPPSAAQIVRFLSPSTLGALREHGTYVVNGGYQKLMQLEMERYQKMGVVFKLSHNVESILRGPKELEIKITDQPEFFVDHVFYTASMKYLPNLVDDLSYKEKKAFSKIKTYNYRKHVVSLSGPILDRAFGTSGIWPNMFSENIGSRPVLMLRPYIDSSVFFIYTYGYSETSAEQEKRMIEEDMAKIGGFVDQYITTSDWNYFPHVSKNLFGFAKTFMGLQGKGGLWLSGETMSFSLVISVYEQGANFGEAFVKGSLHDRKYP